MPREFVDKGYELKSCIIETKSIRDILVILFKWSQLSSFYHEQVPRNKSEGGGRETIQKAKARVLIG